MNRQKLVKSKYINFKKVKNIWKYVIIKGSWILLNKMCCFFFVYVILSLMKYNPLTQKHWQLFRNTCLLKHSIYKYTLEKYIITAYTKYSCFISQNIEVQISSLNHVLFSHLENSRPNFLIKNIIFLLIKRLLYHIE